MKKNVEDILPLSPMQESMLLYAVSSKGTDVLFSQFRYNINAAVDVPIFEQAWNQLIARHSMLRTTFAWKNIKNPLQIVKKSLLVKVDTRDISTAGNTEQIETINDFCSHDRQQGFDFTKAPLLRLTLFKHNHRQYTFIWTTHHLLLDRWCIQPLQSELASLYAALLNGRGADLPAPVPFRRYVQWLRTQPEENTRAFWQQHLAGQAQTMPLTRSAAHDEAMPTGASTKNAFSISAARTRELKRLGRACGASPGTVIQSALVLCMSHLTNRPHVQYGATVNGRSADLPGIDTIIGSLINNVPVAAAVHPQQTIGELLQNMQREQLARSNHEYPSLANIARWCPNITQNTLFDTLLVWLAPVDSTGIPQHTELPLQGSASPQATAYPLTISVMEGIERDDEPLLVHASLAAETVCIVPLDDLLETLRDILENLSNASAEHELADIIALPEHDQSTATTTQQGLSTADSLFNAIALQGQSVSEHADARELADYKATMEYLRGEWQDLLMAGTVNPDNDFFLLGGNSLKAVELHNRIEANTHSSVPLLSLFADPTLAGMTATLSSESWPLKTDIVFPVRAARAGTPLFCIASPDVNTIGYSQLARALPTERPVFVLQAPPDSEHMRILSPAEMPGLASTYVDTMRKIQPDGPYNMLGMCSGALLATEMARHLAQQKQAVSFCGLMDTWALYTVSRRFHLQRLHAKWQALREMPASERSTAIQRFFGKRVPILRPVLPSFNTTSGPPESAGPERSKTIVAGQHAESQPPVDERIDVYGWHFLKPDIEQLNTPATVFRLDAQPYWRTRNRSLGWDRYFRDTTVITLPGEDHLSLLREPSVHTVAAAVDKHLE